MYSDVWKFSLETLEWEEVIIANPSAVPGRWGGINISPVSTEAFGLGFGSSIPYVTFNDSWVIVDYSGNATQSSLKLIDGTGPNGYPVAGTSFTYSLQIHDRRGYPIDYGSEHVSAVAIDTLGRSALGLVRDQQNGTYTITFGTRYAGDFALFISYNGESIFGVVGHMDLLVYPGPLSLTHSYLDVGSLEGATVGGNSTIVIRLVDEQGNPLREEEALHSTTVTVDNGSALTETALGRRDILPLELTYVNGSVTALFDPPAPGIYYLNVRVDGEPIAGSPFSITATIPPKGIVFRSLRCIKLSRRLPCVPFSIFASRPLKPPRHSIADSRHGRTVCRCCSVHHIHDSNCTNDVRHSQTRDMLGICHAAGCRGMFVVGIIRDREAKCVDMHFSTMAHDWLLFNVCCCTAGQGMEHPAALGKSAPRKICGCPSEKIASHWLCRAAAAVGKLTSTSPLQCSVSLT